MAILSASPALALDTGQCLPAQQVRDALKAEGMQPIIVGNRTGYGYPTSLIFFANADGSRGYLIRGDKPLGEQAETACVDSVFRGVKLRDISRPGIPEWALMGDDPAKAEAGCKRDHLGYQEKCSAHDRSLAILNSNGQHVLFMAIGTAINPRDKSIRRDQRLLLTLDGSEASGLLKASTAEGASYILSAYTKGATTQNAAALMGN
ncbi:hypothetical protein CAP40_01485 [Sphingomonas sp. IBVSS2]|uniref:hypothetical protein n=1 Tax=Sphingomonas sp. IBVSS2 TaxID=1985172 RepID=UPI000A2E5CAD|nr:hypothetical protein [Sphingomonas sp. IBVSS2]OSZ69556.1 hypothetical protein CAP40_01485 [Sphingomonas sp. IBVSS2]